MIRIDVEQGSPEWFSARLGLPTASEFDRIITPTGKPSTQADGLMYKLLAEMVTGKPTVFTESDWMKRGVELEAEAREYLAFTIDAEIERPGFILHDSRAFGCSPDGLIAEGGCELKCPAPHTHVQYLLGGKLPNDYIPQVQGSMLVTGAPWWWFLSYHPDMPPLLVKVERDDEYIAVMRGLLDKFSAKLAAERNRLIAAGHLEAA